MGSDRLHAISCGYTNTFFWTVSEFCPFLLTASMDTGMTQTPKYLVMGMRNNKSLECEQHMGHNAMYWYKQSAQKPPELMFVYNYVKLIENNTVPSRFWPECPDSSRLKLHLDALEPEDSATYLCASSKDTALQWPLLPVHKPPGSHQEAAGATQAQINTSCRTPERNHRPEHCLAI